MRLKQLLQKQADNLKAIRAIQDAAGAGSLTDEQRADITRLRAESATLAADIALERELVAEEAALAAGAPVDANTTAVNTERARANIVPGQVGADADPKRGFKSHIEFVSSVIAAAKTGRVDPRLKPLAAAGSDEHGTHSDPSAAFLIPAAFSPDMLSVQAEGDPTAGLTRNLPMTSPTVHINARTDKDHTTSVSGGLVVYRHSETNAVTPSKMATERLTFTAEDLIGAAFATENQIADSPGSFIALIADGFRDEFGRKTLREKLRGTGAGGQYLGVLNSPALVTVAKQSGQAADTIVKENIDKMEARLWGPDSSDRVVYLANKTTLPQLSSLVQNVGTGGVTVPYLTTEGNGTRRLNGRKIFFSEVCSALGDLGDLVLVNWAEYIEGLLQGIQQAESVHVRFLNNERCLKFWLRNCGMPWWRTPLTPEHGDTLSPIVTLAAR